ncbi:SIR2 family protein [Hoeflea sp. WL0058]|uniref:SIR2 family protein n=1 Tax=Flavimaribacter sediminis TaxID=2865987 RepID=A0AAE2ZTZ0_9HYPH|nr:SIR2 family protein [Flavimaribacter sediminis]MBW8640408.1 SIR2 family protein [Flavimaribacter sediminis]
MGTYLNIKFSICRKLVAGGTVTSADNVTVREVLDMLEGTFSKVAEAVANGEFALWLGAGISRKAPSLGNLIDLGIEALRLRAIDPETKTIFYPKLEEALLIAEGNLKELQPLYGQPFESWPQHKVIQGRLWNKYSRFLDIRINSKPSDYMLWEAIDIRAAFAEPNSPAAEHLCIAVLILEGSIGEIASANWDGFIEKAVEGLSGGADGILQVVVDPSQLRGGRGIARLLKFHGCILHASQEPNVFRRFLTGSHTQIVQWPHNQQFTAMVESVTALATSHRTLVMGLSIQDANLQGVFSKAKKANPWPWPPEPNAPGHVFCEDTIKEGQRDVLKIVYGDSYNESMADIEAASHIRSWAEQVLIALVLYVIEKKLSFLMCDRLKEVGRDGAETAIVAALEELRNKLSELAQFDPVDKSRTASVVQAIATWSRIVAIFRTGTLPPIDDSYERISSSSLKHIQTDANAKAARLGDLAIALSLLRHGQISGLWSLSTLSKEPLARGAIAAKGSWEQADVRPMFMVKGAAEALTLNKAGVLTDNSAIVIHADDTWSRMVEIRGGSRRVGAAPGRIGRIYPQHVSMQKIIEDNESMDAMMKALVSEMPL